MELVELETKLEHLTWKQKEAVDMVAAILNEKRLWEANKVNKLMADTPWLVRDSQRVAVTESYGNL